MFTYESYECKVKRIILIYSVTEHTLVGMHYVRDAGFRILNRHAD